MSLGEYAPLSERKRPCVPRPALFALFGALLWAVVGLTATRLLRPYEPLRTTRALVDPAVQPPAERAAAAADAAAAKAIRDDVTAGVIGYLQLEVQLDDLYE